MSDINKVLVATEMTVFKCPNPECGHLFEVAYRCPECGQLVITAEKRNRDLKERCELVRAMETVCRCLNDEDILIGWFTYGVADGDITKDTTDEEIIEEYCTDEEYFAELMDWFLRKMKSAYQSGGLYCGSVVSKIGEENE